MAMQNPRTIGFRIWYTDGSIYESSECQDCLEDDFEQAPDDGVQIVVLYKQEGYRAFVSGGDWYFWCDDPGNPVGYIPTGEWGTWKRKPPRTSNVKRHLKRGPKSEQFLEILAEARASTWP